MKIIRKRLLHLSDIPRDLDEVTTIDRRGETDPRDVDMRPSDVDAIWDQVKRLYRSGVHPGISIALRHKGKQVRWSARMATKNGAALTDYAATLVDNWARGLAGWSFRPGSPDPKGVYPPLPTGPAPAWRRRPINLERVDRRW